MTLKTSAKTKILLSDELLTKNVIAKKLRMNKDSAENLLLRWSRDGLVDRTSHGVYVSALIGRRRDELRIDSLIKGLNKQMVLIGASCWKDVGWCESDTLHVAVSDKPSAIMPRIHECTLYPVGAKVFSAIKFHSSKNRSGKMDCLDPVTQMLWWMEKGSPIMMPAPSNVHWDIVNANVKLCDQMKMCWPELKDAEAFTPEGIYTMIYMDRRDGTTTGVIEGEKVAPTTSASLSNKGP